MIKANAELRSEIDRRGLHYWQVAQAAGVSAGTFTLWMRTPLTPERQQRVDNALESLEQEAVTA